MVGGMTSHSDDDTWWSIDVPIGSDFTLNGTENHIPYSTQWREMVWVLPDLTMMPRGSKREFHSPDGTVSMEVSHKGDLLHVWNLQKSHFGLYYCLILDNNTTFHVTRRGVNMEYHFADDVIKRYQRYLVITAITAGLLALVAILLMAVTYWCHRRDKEEERDTEGDRTEIVDHKRQAPVNSNRMAEIKYRVRSLVGKEKTVSDSPVCSPSPNEITSQA